MEDKKIKVAAVSYLNTKPLLYGFRQHPVMKQMELSVDFPARIARQLINNEVDVGLIPVAVIPQLKEYHIISGYCIGAEGPVASVCLFSDVRIDEADSIYLDYQSRSSVALTQLLLKKYWKISPRILQAAPGFEDQIKGKTAGVVIGDRALQQRSKHPYIYDLAEAWINYTGLPFVFAAWISNKALPEEFIKAFDEATGLGLQPGNLEKVIAENKVDYFDLREYYTEYISYLLTTQKRKGLDRFINLLKQTTSAASRVSS